MFSPRFEVDGYAVSHHGFAKIIDITDVMIEIRRDVEIVVIRPEAGPWLCAPGKLGHVGPYLMEDVFGSERVKIRQDEKGKYFKQGRQAKYKPKWRPWNSEPIYYRLMTPDNWPE
jgi:hypothetical protein